MVNVNKNIAKGILVVIIVLIIVFTMLAETATDLGDSADNVTNDVNSTGQCTSTTNGCPASVFPLTNFFKKKGILFLALMAGVVLVFIAGFMGKKK